MAEVLLPRSKVGVSRGVSGWLGSSLLTAFVGRDKLLAEAQAAVETRRLTTITGGGGIGKSRLARELMTRVGAEFVDGLALVDLAALAAGADIASHAVACMGLKDHSTRACEDQLVRQVGDGRMLMVFDNCEHLREASAGLIEVLLEHCPGLHVLTTSVEPLGLPGEQILVVPPLSLPRGGQRADVEAAEAVQLLVDRTRHVNPDFAVTEANHRDIAELCRRLDGIPLAIELAAPRLRVLSPAGLLRRLDESFSVLAGPQRPGLARHQTMRAMVEATYQLCLPQEQLLWARLSVFLGSFDLDAAEAVCGFDGLSRDCVLDLLDGLVARSALTIQVVEDELRYRQLIPIRGYGAALLDASGERDIVRTRHRDLFLARAKTMVQDWCGPRQAQYLVSVQLDRAEVTAALEFCLSTPGEESAGAELASALRYYWIAGGYLSEGRRWLDRALAADGVDDHRRGQALWVAGWICTHLGDHDASRRYLEDVRTLAQRLDDRSLADHADALTALLEFLTGDLDTAIAIYSRAIEGLLRSGDLAAAGNWIFQMAAAQAFSGDLTAAMATCRRAVAIAREHDEQWNQSYALWVKGLTSLYAGDLDEAEASARAALMAQRAFHDGTCIALALLVLAGVAVERGVFNQAAQLNAVAQHMWSLLGTDITAYGVHVSTQAQVHEKRIAQQLGQTALDEATTAATQVSKQQALDIGLTIDITDDAGHHDRQIAAVLTARETGVAACIAEGLSNKAIAQRLVISPRTVEGHVERILAKLNYTSRTQIVAWVLNHKPAR